MKTLIVWVKIHFGGLMGRLSSLTWENQNNVFLAAPEWISYFVLCVPTML